MSKRKLGQLYIDYTPNVPFVRSKYRLTEVEEKVDPVVPGLPDEPLDGEGDGGDEGDGGEGRDGGEGGDGGDGGDGEDDGDGGGMDPNLPHHEYEKKFHESELIQDDATAKQALYHMVRRWDDEVNKDFRYSVGDAIFGGQEEIVAEPISMHEYAKLTQASYHHYYDGPDAASSYLQSDRHSYVPDFNKWQIDKDLSSADNLVLFQPGEGGVSRVAIAYRGTNPVKGADWMTNAKMFVGKGETTKRLNDADTQFMRVMNKYGRDKISVTGHSQGGGVSAYIAEKYNVPGHHYQPAMFWDAKKRILGLKDEPRTAGGTHIQLRPTNESKHGIEMKRLDDMYADADLEDVDFTEKPLLEGQRPKVIEDVPLTDKSRSIYGDRNSSYVHDEHAFRQQIMYEPKVEQNVYRTKGDMVSAVTMTGLEKNKKWKVNTITSTLENHEDLTNIHSHSNFDPPPVEGDALERAGLLAGEESTSKVLVSRVTKAAAVKGALKGAAAVAGAGLVAYDTAKGISRIAKDKSLSKGDKAGMISIEVAKQGGSLVAGEIAGSAASAAVAGSLAALAPAIVASGGTLAIGLAVGIGVGIGVTMLGDYAEKHYKDIKKGFKKAGKGIEKAGKRIGSGFKKAGKSVAKGFKKAGRKIKHFFHF